MKKWLSVCLCFACLMAMLSGCGSKATIQGVQKSAKAGADAISSEVHKQIKDAASVKGTPLGETTDTPDDASVVETLGYLDRAKAVFLKLEPTGENSLYSPLSLEMALGLLSEGADGATREQLLAFLGSEDYAKVAKAVMQYADSVTTDKGEPEDDSELEIDDEGYNTALKIANSLWVGKDYTLQDAYLGVARDSYKAESAIVDFGDPFKTCEIINSWCEEKTNGLIKNMLNPDSINPMLALILCNSVYFESAWLDAWNVSAGEFTNADGSVVKVDDMLRHTEGIYYETENAVAFGKNYLSGATFIGILPDEGKTLEDIDLNALLASKTYEYDVHASMPKLNYEYSCENLVKVLDSLGVVDAFTPAAQFTKLVAESDELSVSDVLQKCKIELDENGTKAAAVTVIMMKDNAVMIDNPTPTKEVHLNRQFYYMIVDENLNQVLFIGAVNTVEG